MTNGPLLDWTVGGQQAGGVIEAGRRAVPWRLTLHSSVPVEKVEVVVNGAVVFSAPGLTEPGSKEYGGTVNLPVGGWVAVRATGGAINRWPAMDSYAFAHTAPVWIGRVGSSEPIARKKAATDLLDALSAADQALTSSYKETPIPELRAQLKAARDAWSRSSRTAEPHRPDDRPLPHGERAVVRRMALTKFRFDTCPALGSAAATPNRWIVAGKYDIR
ncbi:MAG: hypothetical protein ABI647_22950 [Gemmatimonadota bacterium]